MTNKRDTTQQQTSPSTAIVPTPPDSQPPSPVALFERMAKDPAVDVEKLERLIQLQKDIMVVNAKAAFDTAFAKLQPALPAITKRGQIKNNNGTVRSRYARLEDIQVAVKPVLERHGFSLRHRTEWPSDKPGMIRIVGILAHEQGHSEETSFEAPADASDYRTDIQSMGSTVSYGRRYTTVDLLNITQYGVDDDGQRSTRSAPAAGSAQPANHAKTNEPITDNQRRRLWVIAKNAGWTDAELKDWLVARYQLASSKDITRRNYDEIVTAIEGGSPGQPAEDREPGEEG